MKQKIISAAVVFGLLISCVPFAGVSAFDGGTGNADNPYRVSTVEDLFYVKANPNASYILTQNIDTSSSELSIGDEALPFNGVFDGNGFTIETDNSNSGGLFGCIGSNGTVKNLSVSAGSMRGETRGILADINRGTVDSCFAKGDLENCTVYTGGLIGYNSGTVLNCGAEVYNVYPCSAFAGGLIGCSENGTVSNCYAVINNSGTKENIGILIGSNKSTNISGCYGGRYGNIPGVGTGSDPVTLLSSDKLKSAEAFGLFDFQNTWILAQSMDIPQLRCIFGNGTQDSPYKINSAEDFEHLRALGCGQMGQNTYFRITDDIILKNAGYWQPIGSDDLPFTGNLDGSGYYIIYPTLKYTAVSGIFGVIGGEGSVSNLTIFGEGTSTSEITGSIAGKNMGKISDCNVTLSSLKSGKDLGGIAGENVYGTIENCSFNGSVSGTGSGVGGITGYNNHGTIRNCMFNGTINGNDRAVGGITGDNSGGTIENCAVDATIAGKDEIGGITGRLYNGKITGCYSSSVFKGTYVGGIAGSIIENGDISGCYFAFDKAGTKYGVGSSEDEQYGVSSNALALQITFAGWDFTNTWSLTDSVPELISICGAGTREKPFIIRTGKDWDKKGALSLKSKQSRYFYALGNNIGYYESTLIGSESDPFAGSIDGRNHYGDLVSYLDKNGYIGNLIIYTPFEHSSGTIEYCTSFSHKIASTNDGGIIRNCAVYSKSNAAGGIADSNINGGLIENSCFRGEKLYSYAAYSGAIVGTNNSATVRNSYAFTDVAGSGCIGGIAGRNDNNGVIENCFFAGSVYDGEKTGGFVGLNYAFVKNSYVFFTDNKITVSDGGMFAYQNDGGKFENCYFSTILLDESDDGQSAPALRPVKEGSDAGITPLSPELMKTMNGMQGLGSAFTFSAVELPYIANRYGSGSVAINDPIDAIINQKPAGLSDISGHWAESTINELVELKIINGYEDNTYRPENSVTKGEFLKLLIETTHTPINYTASPYADVNASWAAKYINTAFAKNITANVQVNDTIFGVDMAITRAEAAALIGRLLDPLGANVSGGADFADSADIPEWAKVPVASTVNLGIITGMPDSTFAPGNSLTRAEAATIIQRILHK